MIRQMQWGEPLRWNVRKWNRYHLSFHFVPDAIPTGPLFPLQLSAVPVSLHLCSSGLPWVALVTGTSDSEKWAYVASLHRGTSGFPIKAAGHITETVTHCQWTTRPTVTLPAKAHYCFRTIIISHPADDRRLTRPGWLVRCQDSECHHHRLHGSASPVLMVTALPVGKGKLWPPTELTPDRFLQRSTLLALQALY